MPDSHRSSPPLETPRGAGLRSCGMLLALAIVLWAGGTFAYAGPAAAVVLYHLLFDGGLLLLWLVSATATGAATIVAARRLLAAIAGNSPVESSSSTRLKLVIAAALGLGIMSLVELGLGLIGLARPATAWGVIGFGIVIAVAALVRHSQRYVAEMRGWLRGSPGWGWLWLAAVPNLALATIAAMVPPGVLWKAQGDPHPYDVLEYHLQVPREWFELGRIVPLHHNAFSYFPFNVEMHYLLAMQLRGGPWSGMYLAQLMHLSFIALTVLAVYVLAREFAGRDAAVIAGAAVASVPWLAQLGSVAYDEGGFLLCSTLATGLALRGITDARSPLRQLTLAGAMAGFACGSKLTAVPEVLFPIAAACGLTAMLAMRSDPALGRRLFAGTGFFIAMALLTFSPWLLRNAHWTGNPVFPEAASILGRGHFSPIQVERWNQAHAVPAIQRSMGARATAAWWGILASTQYGYILFPLAGAVFMFTVVRKGRVRSACLLAGFLAFLLVFWLGFTHLQGRFFVLAIPLCGLLIAQFDWRGFAPIGAATIIVMTIVSAVYLNSALWPSLYGNLGIIDHALLGVEDLRWMMPPAAEGLPEDATVDLAGDGRAFVYPMPMSRLRYRTVFDVDADAGRDLIEAWVGPALRDTDWVLVDPRELRRFEETYFGLPAWVAAREEPFAVRGSELRRR